MRNFNSLLPIQKQLKKDKTFAKPQNIFSLISKEESFCSGISSVNRC
jgi:hypothetical protein